MQHHPDRLFQAALERQRQFVHDAEWERLTGPAWPPPWRDPAMWAAVLGPIIGLGFLIYFADVILARVSG